MEFMMFGLMPFENSNDSFRDMFRTLDRMERGFFGNNDSNVCQFRTDIQDEGDHYLLEAELPGFNKEDISIQVSGGFLTVSAQHKEEQNVKEKNYVRKERRSGSYSRSFDISGIDSAGIKASYQDGILNLTLPKAKKELPATQTIAIE